MVDVGNRLTDSNLFTMSTFSLCKFELIARKDCSVAIGWIGLCLDSVNPVERQRKRKALVAVEAWLAIAAELHWILHETVPDIDIAS
jgi:hypothetical protein